MSAKVQVIMTDESVAVSIPGHGLFSLGLDTAAGQKVHQLYLDHDWDSIAAVVDVPERLKAWGKGRLAVVDGVIYFGKTALPTALSAKVLEFCDVDIDVAPLMRFWNNLSQNPTDSARDDLYAFLEHNGIPLTADGCFIAYKRITNDYKDFYTKKFDNSPGSVVEVERDSVDPNRDNTCSSGLHVAAYRYASESYYSGTGRLVEVKVNPRDVVAVPPDYDQEKMRVCRYEVVRDCPNEYKSPLYTYDNSYNQNLRDEFGYEDEEDWEDQGYEDWEDLADDGYDVNDEPINDEDYNSYDEPVKKNIVRTELTPDCRGRVRLPSFLLKDAGFDPGDTVVVQDEDEYLLIYAGSTRNASCDWLATVDSYRNARINLRRSKGLARAKRVKAELSADGSAIFISKIS